MLNFYFSEYNVITIFFLFLFFYWLFFFKLNFYNIRKKIINSDIVTKSNFLKKVHFLFFIKYNIAVVFLIIVCILYVRGLVDLFWWGHLSLINSIFFLLLFFLVFNFLVALFVHSIAYNKTSYSVDYFFAIANLGLLLPAMFLSNNLFTFFFFLELNSAFIFYKFVVSKIWYKNNFNLTNINITKFNKVAPKSFLNVLFFQFWTSFFSSILIVFFFILWLYQYTTTEWFFLNMLLYYELQIAFINGSFFFVFIMFCLLAGLSLKIGLTPFHLFKIEVYRGIPFLSIFFYTTYYFLNYFLFFVLLLSIYLLAASSFYWTLMILVLVFGCFYMVILLFDVNYLKAFFAYSTIVNTMGFTCVVLSNLVLF